MKFGFVVRNCLLVSIVILLVGSASFVLAQTSRGTITGTITDNSGAVVSNAKVVIQEKATGVSRSTVANDAGIYRFDAVLLGDYKVKVSAAGFAEQSADITVLADRVVGADFKLAIGGATESVTVEAAAAQLQTDESVRGGSIDTRNLVNLPIVGQNSLNLMLTLPGVVKSNQSGSLDSGIGSVNGARARSNNFMIDGAYNNDISVAGPAFVITNNDAIQEVAIQTSNFSAEFGRSGGAVINQITKSGTNSVHGTVAEVYRSQIFNASTQLQRNAFLSGQSKVLKPSFKENIPAFTIGGPVYIPKLYNGTGKTFFFAAGQWDRFSSGGVTQNFLMPTDSGVATLQPLAAACPNVANYLKIIGSERGASTGAGVSNIDISLPAAVASTSCAGGARAGQTVQVGNFTRVVPQLSLDNNHQIRIDHIASAKQNLTFRWLYDDSLQTASNIGLIPAFDSNFQGRTMSALFNDAYVINNAWTNEFRFVYTRNNFFFPIADANGIGGTLPETTVGGISNIGVSSTFPQGRIANSFQYQDSMSVIHGKHSFRFGTEILRQLAAQVAPFNGRGQIGYAPSVNNAFTGGSITALANFIDDYSGPAGSVASILFGSGKYRPNLFTYTFFFQDSWKATPDLTLTAGLRYENFGQPANIFKYPAFTGFSDADATSAKKVNPDNNNFGPSIGFAYNPHWSSGLLGRLTGDGKTVIRGGYQVSYDTFYNNLLSNMAGGSPNALSNLTITAVSSAATPRGISAVRNIIPSLQPTPVGPLSTYNSVFDQNIRNPYTNRFSLGVQRETVGGMVVDLSYVGALSRQLFYTAPLNPLLPNATQTGTGLRLFPNRGNIQIRDSGLNSNYNSMQVSVSKRFAATSFGNLAFNSNYTWSKNLDVLTETFGTNSSPQNPSISPALANIHALDYGPSDNDRRHVWVSTMLWDVRGPKQNFLNQVLGGWSLAPIITIQSGTPFTPIDGTDRDFDGSTLGDRPNIGNLNAPINSRAQVIATTSSKTGAIAGKDFCSSGLVNPDAIVAPGVGTCVTANQVHWLQVPGYNVPNANTARRNSVYTGGFVNVDANILKTFKLTERWKLEYRAEIFNIFNIQNFNTPTATSSRLNVTQASAGNFENYALQNNGNRNMRMGIKVIF